MHVQTWCLRCMVEGGSKRKMKAALFSSSFWVHAGLLTADSWQRPRLTCSQRGHFMGCTVGEIGAFLFCCAFPIFVLPLCLSYARLALFMVLDYVYSGCISTSFYRSSRTKRSLSKGRFKSKDEWAKRNFFRGKVSAAIFHLALCSRVFFFL